MLLLHQHLIQSDGIQEILLYGLCYCYVNICYTYRAIEHRKSCFMVYYVAVMSTFVTQLGNTGNLALQFMLLLHQHLLQSFGTQEIWLYGLLCYCYINTCYRAMEHRKSGFMVYYVTVTSTLVTELRNT